MVTNNFSREQLILKINELEDKLALAEKTIIDSNNQDRFSVAIWEEKDSKGRKITMDLHLF